MACGKYLVPRARQNLRSRDVASAAEIAAEQGAQITFRAKACGLRFARIKSMREPSPNRQRTLQLQERVFRFASHVIDCCPRTMMDVASRELWRQLVRAATSSSNNLEEADEASSDADFIAKMKIALREAKEARRCIRFITRCRLTNGGKVAPFEDEARQISAIFATIVINTKQRLASENRKL